MRPALRALAAAATLATAAAVHAWLCVPYVFWPLISLYITSAVLAAHSPLAIHRRMAFLAHAQAHAVLAAALAAAVISLPVAGPGRPAAFYATTLALLLALNYLTIAAERLRLKRDVATGVVVSLQLATAAALLYLVRYSGSAALDPVSLIAGEYVLITRQDVIAQLPLLAPALAFPALCGVKHLYAALDEHFAEAVGIRVRRLDYAFIASMSLAIAASVYTLGVLMPAALLILPGAAASRHSHALLEQIPLAVSVALLSASLAHFAYVAVPWLCPSAALVIVLFALTLARL
ncbi:MAG: metal ABC transporter permease [Thermoproteaceae archaeon]|nr:metal ABC transporter permease [Thermoproteaceae archaeon]